MCLHKLLFNYRTTIICTFITFILLIKGKQAAFSAIFRTSPGTRLEASRGRPGRHEARARARAVHVQHAGHTFHQWTCALDNCIPEALQTNIYRYIYIYASSHFSPRNQICCLASRSAIIAGGIPHYPIDCKHHQANVCGHFVLLTTMPLMDLHVGFVI